VRYRLQDHPRLLSALSMITLRTQIEVPGITGREILEFLLNCTDEEYQRWWPGTHLKFHTIQGFPGDVGTVIFMEEFVGRRRVKAKGVVAEVDAGRKVVWQFKKLVRLPVRLILVLEDNPDAVQLTHTIEIGYSGVGRMLDPLFRLYFSREFATAMDEHVRTEFPKLRDMLRESSLSRNRDRGRLEGRDTQGGDP